MTREKRTMHPNVRILAISVGAFLLATACGGTIQEGSGGEAGNGAGGSDVGGSGGSDGGSGGSDGGSGGTSVAGSGGTGPMVQTDKVDLLFMIDNSASMADKHKVLAATIPRLVDRLVSPPCVDSNGHLVANIGPTETCPSGSSREFPPVIDMHIGIITSSLGGYGADTCSNVFAANWSPRQEDMSHLITRGEHGTVSTYEGKGFLNWDPGGKAFPPGESDPGAISEQFVKIAHGVGQDGCGFESSLEAWYRFLVDPEPYERMVPAPCSDADSGQGCRSPQGVDKVVLQQRADFLRPDSVVGIVMLTDENDCSLKIGGQNYLAFQALDGTGAFRLAPGTNACKTDPYGPDCKSCWEVSSQDYPECEGGPNLDDSLNLRCYRQKERFGIDFLQPVERYIDALTNTHLSDGAVSPLFCHKPSSDGTSCQVPMRSPTQVVLAGIIGVPWQDLAQDPNDLVVGYKPATALDWELILGDPMKLVEPTDPLMVESVDPRTGVHPLTGQALVPPGGGAGHAINGSERFLPGRNDLQYACIFKLPEPLDCTLPENAFGCDCNGAPESPLCWNGSGYGTQQYYAKAYPGKRQLSVLKGIGSQAVVGSICAPNLLDPTRSDYGYGPVLDSLAGRIAKNLR